MTSEVKDKLRESVVAKLLTERKLSSPMLTGVTSYDPLTPVMLTSPLVSASLGTTTKSSTPQSITSGTPPCTTATYGGKLTNTLSTPAPVPTAPVPTTQNDSIGYKGRPEDDATSVEQISSSSPTLDIAAVHNDIIEKITLLSETTSQGQRLESRCSYCPYIGTTKAAMLNHYNFHDQLLSGNSARSHLHWLSYWKTNPAARDTSASPSISHEGSIRGSMEQSREGSPAPQGDNKHSPTLKELLVGNNDVTVVASADTSSSTTTKSASAAGCLRNLVKAVICNNRKNNCTTSRVAEHLARKELSKVAVTESETVNSLQMQPTSSSIHVPVSGHVIEVAPLPHVTTVRAIPSSISTDTLPRHASIDNSALQTVRSGSAELDRRHVKLGTRSTSAQLIELNRSNRLDASISEPGPLLAAMSCSQIYQHRNDLDLHRPFTQFSNGSCIDYSIKDDACAIRQETREVYPRFMYVDDEKVACGPSSGDGPLDMSMRQPSIAFIKSEPTDDESTDSSAALLDPLMPRRNLTGAVSTTHLNQCLPRAINRKRKNPSGTGSITCSPHVMSPLKKMLLHKARSMESLNITNSSKKPRSVKLLSPCVEDFTIHESADEAHTEELMSQDEHPNVTVNFNPATPSRISYLSPAAITNTNFRRNATRLDSHSPFRDSVSSSGISSCNSPISEHYADHPNATSSAHHRVDKGIQCELYTDCQDKKSTINDNKLSNTQFMSGELLSDSTNCAQLNSDMKCRFCGVTFDDDVIYSIHMGCHSHADPFICNLCGKQCENKYCFYTHIMRGHHRPMS